VTLWLTVLVAAFLAVVIVDRVSAVVATRMARTQLADLVDVVRQLRVHVRGAPFLTQALRGRYRRVYVTGVGVEIGPITEGQLRGVLRDVRLPLRAALAGTVGEVPVARIDSSVVLPYAQLPRLARIAGLAIEPDGEYLSVRAALSVPAVGDLVRVTARGELLLVDGQVRLKVSGLRVAGVGVPSVVVGQLSRALSSSIVIPPLPYGLTIVEVRVGTHGLIVRCFAENVTLRAPELPAAAPLVSPVGIADASGETTGGPPAPSTATG
jgi:hypothetical protein